MANKFLTEYVFDEDRIKDGVVDFKLDIAIRGDIALCSEKGNHKVDNLICLLSFLLDVPKEIYSYSVEIAKEYFKEEDVDKLSLHITTKTPLYYLYYAKVLADLEAMKRPEATKKSIFCRYIEDMCTVNMEITQHLLEYVLESNYTKLYNIAQIYLTEIKSELARIKERYGEKSKDDNEFIGVLRLINNFQIGTSPTLTQEKESEFDKFMNRLEENQSSNDDEDEENKVDKVVNNFADFLRSKGVNVAVKTETLDDLGNVIDCEDDNSELSPEIFDYILNSLQGELQQLEESTAKLEQQSRSALIKARMIESVFGANNEEEKPKEHKFRVLKINKFTGQIVDYSDYFDTEYEAIKWKEEKEKMFPQLVEKFVFEIER